MTETVLITGATSGIGAEFARQYAARGDDLVLVARAPGPLDEVARELRGRWGIGIETIAADLLDDEGLGRVLARLRAAAGGGPPTRGPGPVGGRGPGTPGAAPVTVLVNNAGYGLVKPFADNALEDEIRHLRIHVEVPLALAHAALQSMRPRRVGTILTVASVAGFTPRGTYGAAKAAMISFSRWANLTYGPEGIRVTAVCPGFVHTQFHQRMGADKSSVPGPLWLDAALVVREAIRDAAAGKAVSVPSARYKLITALARVAPSPLVARLARRGR
ncbi:SDR family NAD(P)-dependent oxidoreductase [Arthrobacter agilis]|uniref:SDR family NAD(P)-dependent oxidoreductase n=1 Tax=Arthrobacter agilis TaxID=37921 RepID=UPI000B35DAAB|nr:SDR family NAD(P)-dependent oxidoreductase [Arthrobacter agilis]OUM40709.1 short-chain dehydrogenase [Arthrobacter agilis]PPB45317.1 KR domain-containing protein [Arthrobacter agilis]TPV28026.1 SDR family NAD(P)-dependent oxidoreductase [Arthrobacter agilis]VDR31281.1 3-oxoacyl-[acyl-carrier-protein] reductase FabG [Arthrobacter agilis]